MKNNDSQGLNTEITPFFPKKRRAAAMLALGVGLTLICTSFHASANDTSDYFIPARRIRSSSTIDQRVTGQDAFANPQLATLREENQRLHNEIRSLRQELLDTTRDLHAIKSSLFSTGDPGERAKISELRLELANQEDLNQQLFAIAQDLEQSLELKELQVKNLEQDLAQLDGLMYTHNNELSRSSEKYTSVQNALSSEVDNLKKALAKEKAYTSQLEANYHAALNGSNSELEKTILELQKQVASMEKAFNYQSELFRYSEEDNLNLLRNLESDKQGLKEELAHVHHHLDQAKAELAYLEEQHQALLAQPEGYIPARKASELEKSLRDAVALYDEKKDEAELLEGTLAQIVNQANQIQSVLVEKETMIAAQKSQIKDLEANRTQTIADLQNQIKDLEANRTQTIAAQKSQIKDLEASRTQTIADLQDQLEAISVKLEHTERDSESQKKAFSSRIDELMASTSKEINSSRAQLETLSQTILNLNAELATEHQRANQLEEELQVAIVSSYKDQNDSKELAEKLHSTEEKIATTESELVVEQERANQLEEELQEAIVSSFKAQDSSKALADKLHDTEEKIATMESELAAERLLAHQLDEKLQEAIVSSSKVEDSSKELAVKLHASEEKIATIDNELAEKQLHANQIEEQLQQAIESAQSYQIYSDSLNQELNSSMEQIASLEAEFAKTLADSKKQLSDRADYIAALESKLEESRTQIFGLTQTLEDSSSHHTLSQEMIEELSEKLHTSATSVRKLETELIAAKEQLEERKFTADQLSEELTTIQTALQQERKVNLGQNDLLSELTHAQNQYAELQKLYEEVQARAEILDQQQQADEEEILAKAEEIKELKAEQGKMSQSMAQQMHTLQVALLDEKERSQELQKNYSELQENWATMKEEYSSITQHIEETANKCQRYEQELLNKQEVILAHIDEIDALKLTLGHLETDLKLEKQHGDSLEETYHARYDDLNSQMEELTNAFEEEQNRANTLKKLLDKKLEQIASQEQLYLEQNSALQEKVVVLESSLENAKLEAETLREQLASSENKLEENQDLISFLHEQLESHQLKMNELTEKQSRAESALTKKNQELDAMTQEHFSSLDEMERTVNSLSQAIAEEQSTINELNQQKEQYKQQLVIAEKQLSESDQRFTHRDQEIEHSKEFTISINEQLQSSLQRYSELEQELEAHRELLSQKNEEIQELYKDQGGSIDALKLQVNSLSNRLEEEHLLTKSMQAELDATKNNYRETLEHSKELESSLSQSLLKSESLENEIDLQQHLLKEQSDQIEDWTTNFTSSGAQMAEDFAYLQATLEEKEGVLFELQEELNDARREADAKINDISQLLEKLSNYEKESEELDQVVDHHRQLLTSKQKQLDELTEYVAVSERELCNQVFEMEEKLAQQMENNQEVNDKLAQALLDLETEKSLHATAKSMAEHLEKELDLIASQSSKGVAEKELGDLLAEKEEELTAIAVAHRATTMELGEDLLNLALELDRERALNESLQKDIAIVLTQVNGQLELGPEEDTLLASAQERMVFLEQQLSNNDTQLVAARDQVSMLHNSQQLAEDLLVQERLHAEELESELVALQTALTNTVSPENYVQMQRELEAALMLASQREHALAMAEEMTTAAISNHKDIAEKARLLVWEKDEIERKYQRELGKLTRQKDQLIEDFENYRQLQQQQALTTSVAQINTTKELTYPLQAEHQVAKGETLRSISDRYYGTPYRWQDILEANDDLIKDKDHIIAGMNLVIPE